MWMNTEISQDLFIDKYTTQSSSEVKIYIILSIFSHIYNIFWLIFLTLIFCLASFLFCYYFYFNLMSVYIV